MPPPDAEDDWVFPDIYLLTEARDGRVAVPHLQLAFTARGIDLEGGEDGGTWSSTWGELRELSTFERSVLPDGREGLVVVAVEREGRRHRFVVPTTDPSLTEEAVRDLALRHHLTTRQAPRAVRHSLTGAVVLASAATLTLLLLSACHVIHF
jgi:hypothetical protein